MVRTMVIGLLAVALIGIPGCVRRNGGETNGEDSNIVEGSEVYGEIIPADEDIAVEIDEFSGPGEFSTEVSGTYPKTGVVDGYRVQVLAVSFKDNADRVADDLRGRLRGHRVYVEFVNDLYKVRVGDCMSRTEVETLRDELRSMGFADAWIVKSEVNVQ